ncbi:hypothetical protein OJJOAM_001641 [Cupriavidus sp. H18C1]|uniref:hypothetical protein n=1 Tax=Cupriavidus sp. H18C1 TaxID=3241601 RepID=UPI003BB98EFB
MRDKAAYTALAAALPPTQRQQGLRALNAAYIAAAGTAVEQRASRWDELQADALMIEFKDPALAADHFAALASCLKAIEPGERERGGAGLGAMAIARWHKLEVQLDRLPRAAGFVLARALARSLWHFDERKSEHAEALALLQNWQRRAGPSHAQANAPANAQADAQADAQANAQDVALSLALLNQIDKSERPDAWTSAWDRIEAGRLVDQGTEAARLLAWIPVQGRWQRVVAFCKDIVDTHPEQCADMLLALTRLLTRGRDSDPPLHKPDLMAAIHEVALALLERGGPAAPLLQCRWVPKEDLLASIVTHVPWPARAEVLAQWLETGRNGNNTAHELVELLPALEPELNELVAMTRRGATDQATDACARALTALARRCDKSLLANGGELHSALQVAEALLPLVRGMRGGDTPAAVAALAQLVNSIALQALRKPDPAYDHRIEMLLEGTWGLARRLPSAGRQAMLQDLAALKAPPSPPHDMRKEPHFWTQTTLRRAVQAVDADLPAAGSILAELASAEFMVDGIPNYQNRFDDLHKRIWTKAMAVPDHQFVEVAERIALWFGKAPAASEQAREWREARAAFVSRVKALPADPYGPARARIEYWTKLG